MKNSIRQETLMAVLLLAMLLSCSTVLLAKPRPPLPPLPEVALFRWAFDEPYSADTRQNGTPATVDSTVWVESWSGYALNRVGQKVAPVQLSIQATNGYPFVPNGAGTIRCLYAPGWSSGKGAGHELTLLELATSDDKETVTWWSLGFDRSGTVLSMKGQSAAGLVAVLQAEVNFQVGQWHLIALEYSPSNTALFIDAQLAAVGTGLPVLPEAVLPLTSLVVGSDARGRLTAEGQFEELTTFAEGCPPWQLAWYWGVMARQAALGPIVSEEAELARVAAEQAQRATRQLESSGGGGEFSLLMAESGLRLTPPNIPATNTSIAFLTLLEADTNKSYDIYFVPALGLTNTTWNLIAAQGAQSQTNFTVSVTNWMGFFQAFEGNDWDGDGVLNYLDANPSNSNILALTITIEVPANGSTVQ